MFGMAIGMGIVSPAVYSPYLNLLAPKKWAYEFSQAEHNVPRAQNEHVLLDGQDTPTPVDLIRKDRLETEAKLHDVNLVRNMRIDFFGVPMTVAAVGFMLQAAFYADFETERHLVCLPLVSSCCYLLST